MQKIVQNFVKNIYFDNYTQIGIPNVIKIHWYFHLHNKVNFKEIQN